MLTPPKELTDSRLLADLADSWALSIDSLDYQAVGFGSHHWLGASGGTRWFVTVDDLDARLGSADDSRDAAFDRLRAALLTARYLHDAALSFVVAAIPTPSGEIVRRVGHRFALAVYPYIEGRAHSWGEYEWLSDRLAVLDLIVAVHDAPPHTRIAAGSDDLVIQNQDELVRAIDDVGRSWDDGPYADGARALLSRHAASVDRLLARYERLATAARRQPERMVLTHGEPHIANTIVTEKGWMLVDWDTALLAPPERDLWMLTRGAASVLEAYTTATGRPVLTSALELYRIGWDLAEIAIYMAQFRRPHDRTADVDAAWTNLNRTLVRIQAH